MSTRDNQNWDRNRFDRQRDLALQAQDAVRVARVYLTATQSAPTEERIALLQQAISDLHPLKDSDIAQLDVEVELAKLSPSDLPLYDRIAAKLRAYDKSKELSALLEALVAPGASLDAVLQVERRADLQELYFSKLNDRGRAAEHLVHLLESPAVHPEWIARAEELAQNRAWLKVLAASLARAYETSGRAPEEIAILTRELEVARGPRLAELRKRLAILRHDVLGDVDGALEMLEPLVSADPGDDSIRGRFLELSVVRGRKQEAARRLTRAMTAVHDLGARARIGLDLGRLWQENDDQQSATVAYLDVLRTHAEDPAVLAAATALEASGVTLDPEAERDRLWALCAMSPQPAERRAAAETLLNLSEGEEATDELRATALETLSLCAPDRAIEALLALENLYTARREPQRLVTVLERILAAEADAEPSYRALLASQRAERLAQLGLLRRDATEDLKGALSAFAEALSIDPQQMISLESLMDWMNNGPLRLEAAAVLEAHLRTQNSHAELLVALGARAEFDPDPTNRLSAAEEALSLFEQGLVPTESAAWFCAHGLKAALDSNDEQVPHWAEALEKYCAGNAAVEADGLDTALGDRLVSNAVVFGLTVRSAFRLIEVQRFDQAAARIAEAQRFDPSEPQLVALNDVISQVRGDEPEERLQRIDAAIANETGARRVALLTVRASVERGVFGPGERELATWLQVVEQDPSSVPGHQALVDLYVSLGQSHLLEPELRRALNNVPVEDKDSVRWQLAELLANQQRSNEALELYREIVQSDRVDSKGLAHAAELAEQAGDVALQGQVLVRRVDVAETPFERAIALELLGTHVLERHDNRTLAADYFRRALRTFIEGRQIERARALGERLLSIAPEDGETAVVLVHLAFGDGDMGVANTFFDSVAQADTRRAHALLLELEPAARRTDNLGELLNWLDRLVWQDSTSRQLDPRQLLLQKALWLAAIPDRLGEAGEVWRNLIESYGHEADVVAYQQYLSEFPDVGVQQEGRRWLFERRVSVVPDPIVPLLEWARAEADELGDLTAAIALCERALEFRADDVAVLEQLATLRLRAGAAAGALQALETLQHHSAPEQRERIDLKIAELLSEHLDRADLAFDKLQVLLRKEPNNPAVVQMCMTLANNDQVGPRAATLFEELIPTWTAQGVEASVIFNRLLAVVRCVPPNSQLWNIVEDLGTRVDAADQVVSAFGAAIAYITEGELVEQLGQRLVAFADQWSPDPTALATPLIRVLELAPKARWALDRVTFVLSQQGRFGELLDWFDRAIAAEDAAEIRHALLDEAIVTARDLAKDYERAIGYLERQCAERPDDAKAQASLERLYRRGGYTRKLIDLLSQRLQALVDPERAQVEAHIATRWLELGAPDRALEVTENILSRRADDTSALELLERIIDTPVGDDLANASNAAQLRAAQRLHAHFLRLEQFAEAARVLSAELRLPLHTIERAGILHDLADLRANRLGDHAGAFQTLIELLNIDPGSLRNRSELEALADKLERHREFAESLVQVALEPNHNDVALALLADAIRVYDTKLDDPEREAQLHEQLLARTDKEPQSLQTLVALEHLYTRLQDAANLCRVLELRAKRETAADQQLAAWRSAARLALFSLDDAARAVDDWRQVLDLAPRDREALDGLVEALGRQGDSVALIDALELRAVRAESSEARSDLIRAAKLAVSLGNTSRSLSLWQRVANRFGDDRESALAIADLLEKEERWLELRDHLHEYALSIEDDERRTVLVRAAQVELRQLRDTAAAINSFTKARAWLEAVLVVEKTSDPAERAKNAVALTELADAAWKTGDAQAELISFQATLIHARCLLPGIEVMRDTTIDLAQSTKLLRRVTQVRDRLVAAAERPYARERRRALLLEAARVTAGWLREPIEAIRLFATLFAEDPIDAAAEQSFAEYSDLLQSQTRWAELADLLEHRAKAAPEGSPRAIAAWLKAGDCWESKADDPAHALAAYRHAADSDSIPALEAVARLARQLDHAAEAARALEQLVAHAGNRAPIERVIELVDAYLASGDLGRARLRLEATLQAAWHTEIDQRLENLYRKTQQWADLVTLLKLRAERQADAAARIDLLREAAELLSKRLADYTAAADTLAVAWSLEPERSELQLELARACAAAGQRERAVELLEKLIDAFGPRRSRARAELHSELSAVLDAMGQTERAFNELKTAASIDQAQPRVLYQLGKSALTHKAYDLAEQTLSSLLLLLHRSGGEAQGIGQAHAYLVLSEIATQQGDAVRARDYVESAFETALESPEHERRLLSALVELDKPALIQRAQELRWSHVTDPVERCALLRDRLSLVATAQDQAAARERLERRARETWARLTNNTPAQAFRNLAEVFEWLGDTEAATQALNTFADRVDWATATPLDAAALLRLAHRELAEGWDFAVAHRHMETSLRLGITMPDLDKTIQLVLSVAATQFAPLEHRVAAISLCRGLVNALAATAPAADPALGANLLLKLVEMAERLQFDDVAERALATAAGLDPNRRVLMAQLRRLRVSNPDSEERWELTEQLLSAETGETALELGLEIARHARQHQERARAARALSKVIGHLQPGSDLVMEMIELLAWSGVPQKAVDLIESNPSSWLEEETLAGRVTTAIDEGLLNLDQEDRLQVELRWIDWLISHEKLEAAQDRLNALAFEMSDAPVVLERLGRLSLQRGHADEAIRCQLQLLKLATESNRQERVFELYDMCDKLDRLDVARAELEQLHRNSPDNQEVIRRLGRLYQRIDAPTELAELTLATVTDESNPEVAAENLVRAAQLVTTKSPAQALEFLTKAEELTPNVVAELELGRLYAAQGQLDQAVEYYSLAANSADTRYSIERGQANLELAQIHLDVDQLAEAHEALSAAFRFRPKNAGVALQMAELAIDLGDDDGARRALRVLVSLKNGPEDGEDCVSSQSKSKAFYYLGRMLNWQGDAAGARRMIGRALEEDPSNDGAQRLHERLA